MKTTRNALIADNADAIMITFLAKLCWCSWTSKILQNYKLCYFLF